jgi:DNA-binding transcriptional MerR regulator/effector-binding domain-containing protein
MEEMEMKEDLYSIGEVCRICRVSASKLRYYDEIGVIKPAKVDEENGYRYYGREVLLELPILFFLKDLGFSLKEAREALLRNDLDYLEEVFAEKSAAIGEEMKLAKYRRRTIDVWIDLIHEWRGAMGMEQYPIILKYLPEIVAVSLPPPDFKGVRYENLLINTMIPEKILEKNTGLYTYGALYLHYPEGNRNDLQTVRPLIGSQEENSETFPFGGFSVVSRYHRGSFATIDKTVAEMKDWAAAHNFCLRGDLIERSVIDCWSVLDEDQWLMEVYLPIEE